MGSPFELLDPPVYALTSRDGDREDALIATWVFSVTLIEPYGRVIVALSPDHLTTALIVRSKRFVVNLLAEGQHPWIPRFGLLSGRVIDKLADIEVTRTRAGLAILPGTCGYADCEVNAVGDAPGPLIISGVVKASESRPDRTPLTIGSAFRALPRETVAMCEAQRRQNGLAGAPF